MAKNNVVKFDTKYTRDTSKDFYQLPKEIYNKEQYEYHIEVDALGHEVSVKNDKPLNWYEQIQSYHDGCALKCLLDRYKQTGDLGVINKQTGSYFDASDMPTDLISMYKKVQEGERYFNNLPLEVKQLFNNSFTEFLSKDGVIPEVKKEVVPEVKVEVKEGDTSENKQ